MDISTTPRAISRSSEMDSLKRENDRLKRENDHLQMVVKKHEFEVAVQEHIISIVRNPKGYFMDSLDIFPYPRTFVHEALNRLDAHPERYFLNSSVMSPGTAAYNNLRHQEWMQMDETEKIREKRRETEDFLQRGGTISTSVI